MYDKIEVGPSQMGILPDFTGQQGLSPGSFGREILASPKMLYSGPILVGIAVST